MLKASALYMVIVMALVMAVICSSLITAAYFYKLQYQKTFRYNQLQNNLASGLNILLESSNTDTLSQKGFSLFGGSQDTVMLSRQPWGLYQIGTVQTFINQDTLKQVCTLGNSIDSARWAALYVIDEDRPLSAGGKTTIRGTTYLPKAGINEDVVNVQVNQSDKRVITGSRRTSQKTLPALDSTLLMQLVRQAQSNGYNDSLLISRHTVVQSFLKPALTFNFGKQHHVITNRLEGHIILYSDTTLTIAAKAKLKNVIVFAKGITVKRGFKGTCQLFASDSIQVEPDCHFGYPSVMAVIRHQEQTQGQEKLSLGERSTLNGILLTYEKVKNEAQPLISLEKKASVTGQIYSQGLLNYRDSLTIRGSIYTSRFLYQPVYTRYENYLINITLDAQSLSSYYLTSGLLPAAGTSKKVLQWLK